VSATEACPSAAAAQLAVDAHQSSTTQAQRIELALRLGRQCQVLARAGRALAVPDETSRPMRADVDRR
jgi:hypothetical protein